MKNPEKKHFLRKFGGWILGIILILVTIIGFFLYNNFNRLLSEALMKSFNANVVSDLYELKFHSLKVNPLLGNIVVRDVEILPREKPLKNYPYINSSVSLRTKKIVLINVEILTLLKGNSLKLEQVMIDKPELKFMISDAIPIFMPFEQNIKDSIPDQEKSKRTINSFFLKEFNLENASFHIINSAKKIDLCIKSVNISLNDLLLHQNPSKDIISYSRIKLSIGEITGSLKNEKLKYISLKNYMLTVDSLKIQKSLDSMIYHFYDFDMEMKDLNIQTGDSIFNLTLQSLNLSYRDSILKLKNLAFKPNLSDAELQKRYKYQNTQFSGTVGVLNVTGINYDSFIYNKKLLIDKISLDSVKASIFKDKTKPFDSTHFPKYLGQSIKDISMPLLIKKINATNVNLINIEKKINGTPAIANINRATITANFMSNLPANKLLSIKADAYLEDKVHFWLNLGFDYKKPQFSIEASFDKFDLPDLNSIIKAYTPTNVISGTVDKLSFSGTALSTYATGTMKFLYHDLKVDLELKEQAKWKNSVLAFAANTIINSANPVSANLPPRIVQYKVERDMNKSFVNITIKSALTGLKETIIMSKENRKAHRESKKQAKLNSKNADKK